MDARPPRNDHAGPLIRVRLLGPLHLEGPLGPIHLSRRKTTSLLAYLVLHPEVHRREELAALFWGDSPETKARNSLRTSLANLRSEIHPDLVLSDRETVQRNPEFPLWVDALEFQRHLSDSGELERAVSLYQGDLLTDLFEDWVTPEREHYRGLYLEGLLQLARAMRASGDYERAIAYAKKILAQDPASERAYQHLMFCYLAIGDRTAALKQYEKCQRALRDELASEPTPETIALYEWIKLGSAQRQRPDALLTNLPIPLTSFIGRKAEIAEAKRLLTRSRLVTLTGAGGSGKTRLAIRIAMDLVGVFQDGVWWVDLAGLSSAELVPAAIARSLGIQETSSQPVSETLVASVGPRRLLLVLDNCEHLITACRQIAARLLAACPSLTILATSREVLGIAGEITRQVPALTLPDQASETDAKPLLKYEAIRLFNDRATAINGQFELTKHNSNAVAQICLRLDGIPLAIELAAARIKVLSVEQIAERLDDCLNLLTTGSPTAPLRHQTLRASIDCSYELLTARERDLFCRLAVFAGGFTLQAAESVARSANAVLSAPGCPALLDILSQLVDKSLINTAPLGNESRYYMLDTVRRYALDKLSAAGEADRCRDGHLDFFLQLAESAEPLLAGADRDVWLPQLDAEHDNLLAALEWSQRPQADVSRGLRLAGALYWFWYNRGLLTEGRSWLEKTVAQADASAVAAVGSPDLSGKAQALFALGSLAANQGDNAPAQTILEQSIRQWRRSLPLNKRGLALASVHLAEILRQGGDPASARSLCEEAAVLSREQGDQWGVANALISLGLALRDQEQYDLARAAVQRAISMFDELKDEFGRSEGLRILGLVAYRQGEYEEASARMEEEILILHKLRDRVRIALATQNLALIALNQGDDTRAKQLFEQALALGRSVGNKFVMANCLQYFGHLATFRDDMAAAQASYAQALAMARTFGPIYLRALCLLGFAAVAAVQDRPERAARLWGASEAQIAKGASFFDAADRRLYARSVARAQTQLGQQTFETLRAEGKTMTMDQATEYALGD